MVESNTSIILHRFTTFGDLLKYLHRRAGLTQLELSIAVGYSDAQICRLEQNERLPDLATLTARFLPILQIEGQPEVTARLLDLAAAMRREDAPAAGLSPYKGLYFFDEGDAEIFFGREELTHTLVERLKGQIENRNRFLAVIGASGSGKSSIVRAGLIPALRWQPNSSGWPILVMTPSTHPLEALAKCFARTVQSGMPVEKSISEMRSDPHFTPEFLRNLANQAGASQSLLVVDQFEEVFSLCHNQPEQEQFIENLIDAAFFPNGTGIVIIVMRADFYPHCARFDRLRQALAHHQEYIGPMDTNGLRTAIEEPAKRGRWEIEPGLVEVFLHDVGADAGCIPEPGALPLLSHALLETWRRRRGRTLTLSGYTASGGVRGAIAETAEAVFHDQLAPQQRIIARQIFLRLTEMGGDENAAGTRRRVSLDELITDSADSWAVQEVLTKLADARLVITSQQTAEVAHEALIREWPTLRNWLDEDREGLRTHRRLTEAAQEWNQIGRDPSGLYRGARLAQAVEWAEDHPSSLNVQERKFLEESILFAEQEAAEREAQRQRELKASRQLADSERARAEQQASANRRLRQRSLYLLIAFVLAGLLAASAGFFWSQSAQANRLATSRELAAAAVNNIAIDPERSVLLALEALGRANTLEARNALHQTLPELHLLRTIEAKHEGGSPGTEYSPDGSRLASIGAFGDVKLWDSETGEIIWELPAGNNELGYSLAFSPNGKYLAVAYRKAIALLDPDNGEEIYRIVGLVEGAPNNEVVHISFSPDSRFLATANLDGMPTIIEVTLQKPVATLTGHSNPCDGVAFNQNGTLIATSDDLGVVIIWDARTYQEIDRFQHSGNVHNIAFSPQGDKLASASEDGTLLVWDISSGDMLQRVSGNSGFYDVAFIPGSNHLAAAGQDGTTKIWDSDSGQLLLTLAGNTSTVISLSANEDGIRLATSGYDGSLKIWDTSPGREVNTTQGHSSAAWDISYSPDGNRLASVGDDGWVKVWNPSGNSLVYSVHLADHLSALTFSQDGHRIAVGSQSGTIYILDALTGKTTSTLQGHSYLVFDLSFSPDNRLLISSSWDGTARLWDLALGKERFTFQGQWSGVAFNRDGASVFTGGLDRFVHRWDTASGSEIQRYGDGILDPYAIQTNPAGDWIAVGYQDGSIIFYEISSSEMVRALAGHAGLIIGLAFSRDGAWLASASFDRLAKVWSVDTGTEQFSLYGNTSNVFAVSFSEDGRLLATSGADGTVRTYTTQLDELVSIAKARVTRSLTEAECHKYLHQGCN